MKGTSQKGSNEQFMQGTFGAKVPGRQNSQDPRKQSKGSQKSTTPANNGYQKRKSDS